MWRLQRGGGRHRRASYPLPPPPTFAPSTLLNATPAGPFFMYMFVFFLSLMLYTSFGHCVLYFSPNVQVSTPEGAAGALLCAPGRRVPARRGCVHPVHAVPPPSAGAAGAQTPQPGGGSPDVAAVWRAARVVPLLPAFPARPLAFALHALPGPWA